MKDKYESRGFVVAHLHADNEFIVNSFGRSVMSDTNSYLCRKRTCRRDREINQNY